MGRGGFFLYHSSVKIRRTDLGVGIPPLGSGSDLKVLFALCSGLLPILDRRAGGALMWLRSPIKNFCFACCKRYRFKITGLVLLLIVAYMLFKFIYAAPVSGYHGDRDKGTGCPWEDCRGCLWVATSG